MTMSGSDDEQTVLITAVDPPRADASSDSDRVSGGRIGAYRLLELIGEGGMGQVWLAEQREPIQRKVALKLVRRQLAGSLAPAYFEIERQALARMDHPAIAKVFDAGRTPDGYPWFAMEFVVGRPLAYPDAYDLFKRARESAVGSLGEHHPQTASSLAGMGQANIRLERYVQAEQELFAALSVQESVHGRDNPETARTRAALVALYEAWNRPEQADRYRDRSAEPAAPGSA